MVRYTDKNFNGRGFMTPEEVRAIVREELKKQAMQPANVIEWQRAVDSRSTKRMKEYLERYERPEGI